MGWLAIPFLRVLDRTPPWSITRYGVDRRDKLGTDEPTDPQTVYRVVKTTEQQSGVTFSPHTARRTFITEALTMGAPLADVQAQVGHKQESMTLRYAHPVDAKSRREQLRLRYG